MSAIGSKRYVTAQLFDFQLDAGGGEGKPHCIMSLRVVDGPDAGLNLTTRGYLTEKAAPITMDQLRALGWTGTKLSKAMSEGLGSRKATVRLTMEEYNGKVREKVTGIYAPKSFGPKNPIESDALASFDALFEDVAASSEVPALTDAAKAGELPAAKAYERPVAVVPADHDF